MDAMQTYLAEEAQAQYFGKYRGFVLDNADPENRGRIIAEVPSILGNAATPWALPCLPFGGMTDHGLFVVPQVGAQVWVEFEEGNLAYPIWVGTFWQDPNDVPESAGENAETSVMLKTPGGHILHLDDKTDAEAISLSHSSGATFLIDETGSVAITDQNGGSVKVDADSQEIAIEDTNGNRLLMSSSGTIIEDSNGNVVEMSGAKITVKGQQVVVDGQQVFLGGQGGEPILKGQSFLNLFMTHVHPTPSGPSGPPIPQGEPISLSKKVMTS